jgi:osmotically-inducible protein OsmY
LASVKSIINRIRVMPKAAPVALKDKIQQALERNAHVGQSRITIEADGGEVALGGTVSSLPKREEAERVAWSAPGVTNINNQIVVNGDCDDNELGKMWVGNQGCEPEGVEKRHCA